MQRSEYLERAQRAYDEGKISAEAYDAAIMDADIFCDDKEDSDSFLPRTYAEIEYDDMDTLEAYEGSRFDDMNYLWYLER